MGPEFKKITPILLSDTQSPQSGAKADSSAPSFGGDSRNNNNTTNTNSNANNVPQEEKDLTPEEQTQFFLKYSAEADLRAKRGDFVGAIGLYSSALRIRPGEKNCLIARSRCLMLSGDHKAALADINESLNKQLFDPATNTMTEISKIPISTAITHNPLSKALLQKSEIYYVKGDFETSLVWYHRGNALFPNLEAFKMGIDKTTEAIKNAVGHAKTFHDLKKRKQENDEDVYDFLNGSYASKTSSNKENSSSLPPRLVKSGAPTNPTIPASITDIMAITGSLSANQERVLLGDLYEDKVFLEELARDPSFATIPFDEVEQLVQEGLHYINGRLNFWRQEKPIPHHHYSSRDSSRRGSLSSLASSNAESVEQLSKSANTSSKKSAATTTKKTAGSTAKSEAKAAMKKPAVVKATKKATTKA